MVARPPAVTIDRIPQSLRRMEQWVVWSYSGDKNRQGKYPKVPRNPHSDQRASVTDPTTWASFPVAYEAYQKANGGYDGIGYVFAEGGPHAGVDIDHCRDPESGELSDAAERLLADLDTYTEVSPSGTGVKAIVEGRLEAGGPNRADGIEVYGDRRFFAITGRHIEHTPPDVNEAGEALARLQNSLRPTTETKKKERNARPPTAPPVAPRPPLPAGDAAIIAAASRGPNGAKFATLNAGDWNGYDSPSEAMLALAVQIEFRLRLIGRGHDPIELARLVLQSPLFAACELLRAKWDSPRGSGTWGSVYVIDKAIATCPAVDSVRGYRPSLSLLSSNTPHPNCVLGELFETAISRAWAKVEERGVPAFITARVTSRKASGREGKRKLATFCYHLAADQGGRFFLSCLDAAKFLNTDYQTAARWLRELTPPNVGLLRRLSRGNKAQNQASEYQWRGPTAAAVAVAA